MIKNKKLMLTSLAFFSSLAFSSYADKPHFVIASNCLAKEMQTSHQVVTSTSQFALLKLDEAGMDELTDIKHTHMKAMCGGFMDVTERWQQSKLNANTFLTHETSANKKAIEEKYQIQHEKQVTPLLSHINSQFIQDNLTAFTNFKDRDAKAQTGVDAANWIKNTLEKMVQQSGRKDVSIFLVETNGYKQPSVVMKVGDSTETGIVVGGHIDTLTAIQY